ncbi:helix-turn-helix transcriptional regulator [Actinacidiphila paucisporea]|uniref:Regulatory protein, luxR family n=1 Tax=Actinacidiphila paucisporea TaxID=310782 RepID=A0A1M7L2T9_9ACTN|nr:helix-turn-helix transcriptional regulator [Actinacidiphila paucisporea]SHM72202.1 regulatory protein, luxR family [Actinacidiphila paucisporea]
MLGSVQTQSLSPVFIGRDAELARLASVLAAADAGESQAVLIGGEAGVGKTRLTEEFVAAARAAGAVTAVGGCVEIGADGLPFAPVSAALRDLYRTLGPELTAAAAGQQAELARLLPELAGTEGVRKEPNDEDGRVRLFELTARLLERLGTDRTIVVVVEDLHWADRSTRELLAYLFRSLQRCRVLLAATYRADDIHRRHPLRPFLAETDRLRRVERFELSRFSRAEVRSQLVSMMADEPDDTVVDQVFARSDGNPFFVEELACSLRRGCSSGLSDSLRDLLLVRVEALSEDAQRVAKFVAEGGNSVEYRLLAAITGLSEDDLLAALRVAVGASILLPTDSGEGYRFRHSLVREAVGDDLLPGERSRINRRYAEAVESDPGLVPADERAARLASYWYAAHDPARALPAVLSAAVEARHRHAYAEQYQLLERALELWDDTPETVRAGLRPADYTEAYPPCDCAPGTPLDLVDLLAELTVAARLSGERERAYTMAKRALRLMERSGSADPLRAAWFWAQRSKVMEVLGRGDGWEELARARELVRGLPPSATHAEVLAMIAGWIMVHKSGAEGIAIAGQAVQLARIADARDIELHARVTLGLLQADSGDVDGGIAGVEEVRRLVSDQRAPLIVSRTYGNLSSVLEGAGRSAEAVRVSGEGLELIGDQVVKATKAWLLSNAGESLYMLGRYEESADRLAAARRAVEGPLLCASVDMYRAFLALSVGDTETAADCHASAAESFRYDTQPQHQIPLRGLGIRLAVAHGRYDEARRGLLAAIDAGFPNGTARYAWPLIAAGAAAEADGPWPVTGDPARGQVLDRIRTAARELPRPTPLYEAYALLVEAELARAEGRHEPELWAAAEAAFAEQERPVELAAIRYRYAEALLARGPDARGLAGCLLAQAHGVSSAIGAKPLAADIAALAQRARLPLDAPAEAAAAAPVEPVDPADSLGLTARERDVLRLVADGRTNRQIAEELFISPKTASVHVSNILAKLTVSTRGEAAALAHRLHLFAAAT